MATFLFSCLLLSPFFVSSSDLTEYCSVSHGGVLTRFLVVRGGVLIIIS